MLSEEIFHLVVAVELAPHLLERVDLHDQRLGASATFPPVGQEEHASAEASGEGPEPGPGPVQAQEFYDATAGVTERRHGLRRFDEHWGTAKNGEWLRLETGEDRCRFKVENDFDPRGGKRVTQRRVVGLLGRASDQVGRDGDARTAPHVTQERRQPQNAPIRVATDHEKPGLSEIVVGDAQSPASFEKPVRRNDIGPCQDDLCVRLQFLERLDERGSGSCRIVRTLFFTGWGKQDQAGRSATRVRRGDGTEERDERSLTVALPSTDEALNLSVAHVVV